MHNINFASCPLDICFFAKATGGSDRWRSQVSLIPRRVVNTLQHSPYDFLQISARSLLLFQRPLHLLIVLWPEESTYLTGKLYQISFFTNKIVHYGKVTNVLNGLTKPDNFYCSQGVLCLKASVRYVEHYIVLQTLISKYVLLPALNDHRLLILFVVKVAYFRFMNCSNI